MEKHMNNEMDTRGLQGCIRSNYPNVGNAYRPWCLKQVSSSIDLGPKSFGNPKPRAPTPGSFLDVGEGPWEISIDLLRNLPGSVPAFKVYRV